MIPVLAPGTHSIEVAGIRQRYHVAGSGPLCLVQPDGPGVHWEYLRLRALEQHLTMVYLEPAGTGGSGWLADGDYSQHRFAELADGVVDHLDGPQVHFLGHGHGGTVALQYALAHPERTAGLILYSTAPTWDGADFDHELALSLEAYLEARPDDEAVRVAAQAFGSGTVSDSDSFLEYLETIQPLYFADYAHTDLTALREVFDATLMPRQTPAEWDVREQLGLVSVPALVLSGAHDVLCGPRWADVLTSGLSHATAAPFALSGHFAHLEQPEAFTKAVVDFLSASR
ncbi:proline iminopeptidase [Crossiella equi]|uniref:Proline iminopeptidase n=1 Tax=Crossiella equi TaxID=130796 RepID=A0ABS5AQ02_9PSEU|nr:alpha/beta hydrolase [Crossiella equi]MBP2478299.1 proline iminopeptidase [Crossiella equi]